MIPNFLNKEDIDIVFDEIVNNRDFEKSDCKIETYESIGEKNMLKNMKMGVSLY